MGIRRREPEGIHLNRDGWIGCGSEQRHSPSDRRGRRPIFRYGVGRVLRLVHPESVPRLPGACTRKFFVNEYASAALTRELIEKILSKRSKQIELTPLLRFVPSASRGW